MVQLSVSRPSAGIELARVPISVPVKRNLIPYHYEREVKSSQVSGRDVP